MAGLLSKLIRQKNRKNSGWSGAGSATTGNAGHSYRAMPVPFLQQQLEFAKENLRRGEEFIRSLEAIEISCTTCIHYGSESRCEMCSNHKHYEPVIERGQRVEFRRLRKLQLGK